ncbi:hypothetical protein BH09VER1_BH09VER1_11470 [soil metagenome]
MKWLKENPFLAGLGIVTVIICGVLIFLALGASEQYNATVASYNEAVGKLHGLQNRAPFPNKENYDKLQAIEKDYKKELSNLRAKLVKMEIPLKPDIKPQQFQDELRVAVDDLVKKAAAANVNLPKDFYLGFSQYMNSPPSDRATPALDRQLTVISKIANNLIDLKVQSIDGLDRKALPEEGSSAPNGKGSNSANSSLVDRFPFDVSFTAEQSRFRVAFNSLLSADQFLLVRAISVQNTNQEGPPTAQPEQVGATSQPGAPGEDKAKNDLNVILGRELVKVTLRLEMIHFAETAETHK